MHKWFQFAGLGAVVAVAVVGSGFCQSQPAPVVEQLSAAEFDKLLTAVRPAAGEDDFDKIPWRTSIWDARVKAAKEGKPILLWEMDGHPLGCG
jgi:hypothetical protein